MRNAALLAMIGVILASDLNRLPAIEIVLREDDYRLRGVKPKPKPKAPEQPPVDPSTLSRQQRRWLARKGKR